VETNFLPGRTFNSLEDLNQQALEWSTIRMANRPIAKSGLIPAKAFEHEQLYLIKMVNGVEPPYRAHSRATDQYGYAAFEGNYYWIPGSSRAEVAVLEYVDHLKIYQNRQLLAEYKLAQAGVKNQLISPEGMPTPAYKPKDRKRPTEQEEKKLRTMAEEVDRYLNFALQEKGISKHRFLRQLFSLSQKVAPAIFIATVERALKYRISDIETIERICLLHLSSSAKEVPYVNCDEDLESREAYQQGRLSDSVDLSVYDWWEQEED
jgi:hypothetical protein